MKHIVSAQLSSFFPIVSYDSEMFKAIALMLLQRVSASSLVPLTQAFPNKR